ncbi:MAG: toprim domain-containing protein [Planctomycetia bacterium]|nr:toprim domain-containing protein [Planctomycetia bacterium]
MADTDWKRVCRQRPCPICNRPKWCIYVGDDDAPDAVICQRVESPRRIGEAGWLHRLRDSATAWPRWEQTIRLAVVMTQPAPPAIDLQRIVADAQAAAAPEVLERFAQSLVVTVESLYRLGVGYVASGREWLFPMEDASGRIVGIRRRLPGGKKLSVRGGHEGLFVPTDLAPGNRLLICEGPTDTAALLDLGFGVLGRPSCTGGVQYTCDLIRRLRPTEAVIVADADKSGRDGAARLAARLLVHCAVIKIIAPPAGIKDARQWKIDGATAADVAGAIDAAPAWRVNITTQKGTRSWKKRR